MTTVSENSDVIHYSEDQFVSDSSFASSESNLDFEEDVIKMNACTCAMLSRAHKMDCPISSRNRYALFLSVSPGELQDDKEGS